MSFWVLKHGKAAPPLISRMISSGQGTEGACPIKHLLTFLLTDVLF